jgi:hypothetical protein
MAKAYVTQLMELFETKIAMVIEWQNPDYADRLALMQLQLGQLAQARDKCDFETQLYCVNRLATLMGQIEGMEIAREKEKKDVQTQDGGIQRDGDAAR